MTPDEINEMRRLAAEGLARKERSNIRQSSADGGTNSLIGRSSADGGTNSLIGRSAADGGKTPEAALKELVARGVAEQMEKFQIFGGDNMRISGKGLRWVIDSNEDPNQPSVVEEINQEEEACPGPSVELTGNELTLVKGQLTSGGYTVYVDAGGPWTVPVSTTVLIWIAVTGNAVEEDGVLTGGFNGTGYTVTSGTSLPSPVIPSHGSPAGTAIIMLGAASRGAEGDATLDNKRCGDIQLTFCPGQGFGWDSVVVEPDPFF